MAITYTVKDTKQGGIVIRINNASWSQVGNVIIKSNDNAVIYEHDFGNTITSVAIKIPAEDITNKMGSLTVIVDSNGKNAEFNFYLSDVSNMANWRSPYYSGDWIYLDCKITW